jgi:hypothetical protein
MAGRGCQLLLMLHRLLLQLPLISVDDQAVGPDPLVTLFPVYTPYCVKWIGGCHK